MGAVICSVARMQRTKRCARSSLKRFATEAAIAHKRGRDRLMKEHNRADWRSTLRYPRVTRCTPNCDISRGIRQLEHSIGMTLDRSSGGVKLTSAGRDFPRAARTGLEQMDFGDKCTT
jgi:hypothetical protein